eukprot:Clim_evm72s128 gene=Clim_evmTU72s128
MKLSRAVDEIFKSCVGQIRSSVGADDTPCNGFEWTVVLVQSVFIAFGLTSLRDGEADLNQYLNLRNKGFATIKLTHPKLGKAAIENELVCEIRLTKDTHGIHMWAKSFATRKSDEKQPTQIERADSVRYHLSCRNVLRDDAGPLRHIQEKGATALFRDAGGIEQSIKDTICMPLSLVAADCCNTKYLASLRDLPVEAKLQVLAKLDVASLVEMSRVNREFRAAAKDERLWYRMYFMVFLQDKILPFDAMKSWRSAFTSRWTELSRRDRSKRLRRYPSRRSPPPLGVTQLFQRPPMAQGPFAQPHYPPPHPTMMQVDPRHQRPSQFGTVPAAWSKAGSSNVRGPQGRVYGFMPPPM